jgi:hypothetical protein
MATPLYSSLTAQSGPHDDRSPEFMLYLPLGVRIVKRTRYSVRYYYLRAQVTLSAVAKFPDDHTLEYWIWIPFKESVDIGVPPVVEVPPVQQPGHRISIPIQDLDDVGQPFVGKLR